jgi:hypothetical protein
MSDRDVTINKDRARSLLFEQAAKAMAGYVDPAWEEAIRAFSSACDEAGVKTHIAFLGTAILAKCVEPSVDVFAHKLDKGERGYNARALCHEVLVPNAPELDVNLGATGREPLNNQPYFRSDRVSRDMIVRKKFEPIVGQLCDILDRVQFARDDEARQALRAFIIVRRRFGARYSDKAIDAVTVPLQALVSAIEAFVADQSEGGRRAQAVVAGLMDLFAGVERVVVRRINDPSRSTPGDVSVRSADGWERALEVRDKPVTREDLYILTRRCAEAGVSDAFMIAVASTQPEVPVLEAQAWATERGVALSVFFGWDELVRQVLTWSPDPTLAAASVLPEFVRVRLIELEVEPASVEAWTRSFEL